MNPAPPLVAIVLPCPAAVAAAVALPGAEPPDDLHVTLACLGPADALGDGAREALGWLVALLAAGSPPVAATLGGVGRFSGPDADALHLTVDAPDLVPLRAALLAALPSAGLAIDPAHGFDPHLTLAYLPPGAPAPLDHVAPVPVCFDRLALWTGGTRTSFPLAGPAPAALGAGDRAAVTLDARPLPDGVPTEMHLFAPGWNDTVKGRFLLDDEAVAAVLAAFADHGVELAIDFDHNTFVATAEKKDVAGYIARLENRPDGLWAAGIRWTAKGLAAISPGADAAGNPTSPEYRYHSPAIQFDAATRRIARLDPVALVTFPASKGQRPLVLHATPGASPAPPTPPGVSPMQTLLTALSLAIGATEAEALAALNTIKTERAEVLRATGAPTVAAALGTIEGWKTAAAALDAVKAENAQLRADGAKRDRDALLARGRDEGKLSPALEKLYADKAPEELAGFLAVAPVIPALLRDAAGKAPGAKPPSHARPTDEQGRTWDQIPHVERARLHAGNPDLYAALRDDHEARNPR